MNRIPLLALLALGACTTAVQPALHPTVLPHPSRQGWYQITQMVPAGYGDADRLSTEAGRREHAVRVFGPECVPTETAIEARTLLAQPPIGGRFELISIAVRCGR